MSHTPLEQACLALAHLLESKEEEKLYWAWRDTHELTLQEHPFGLDTRLVAPGDGWQGSKDTLVIADPGYTDESVHAMLLMLRHHLRSYRPREYPRFRLRIIRARIAKDQHRPGKYVHNIFFELITGVGTFLCGACSDCSGEGGYGRKRLEAVFNFVAAIYEISVEEAVVPLAKAVPFQDKLHRAYGEFQAARST